jgi:PAS domain S-box-containing protein
MKLKAAILVVEDDFVTAKALSDALGDMGYSVTGIAVSGEAAVEQVRSHAPDLVLMDIRLQGQVDGIQAAGVIRERFRIPVVYLTAYADEKTLERARVTQPYGYLVKPFVQTELHSTIQMALYRHHAEEQDERRQDLLFATIHAIGDAVITTDSAEQVTFLNPVAESLTGLTGAEAKGRPLVQVLRITRQSVGKPLESPAGAAMVESTLVWFPEDTVLTRRDGTVLRVDGSAAPLRDHRGAMTGAVLVFRPRDARSEDHPARLKKTREDLEFVLREAGDVFRRVPGATADRR